MSNTRRLKVTPREPNPVERAFRDELAARGCPACGSRKVTGKLQGDTYRYTLACLPSCPTHGDAAAAHRIASEAAKRAGVAADEPLSYRAVDTSTGEVAGVVVGAR